MRNCASEVWSFGPSRNDDVDHPAFAGSTVTSGHSFFQRAAFAA
jgi:hypothetical protein